LQFWITSSGRQKGELTKADMLLVGDGGWLLEGKGKPSAETALHQVLYRKFDIGAVFHVHTIKSAWVSAHCGDAMILRGLEMIKGFDRWEPDAEAVVPVVENHHDIPRLAQAVEAAARSDIPAVLVRNHGIYAWGSTCAEARRHVEITEYLCEYSYLTMLMSARRPEAPSRS
jgi:methylthioribulose-1-phosphate dehydratase